MFAHIFKKINQHLDIESNKTQILSTERQNEAKTLST